MLNITPLVILLDLDGTIIGNISPQVCEYELISMYCPSKLKQFKLNLQTQFHQGLLRPSFTSFLDALKYKFENVEFFVYTASESKWAHLVIGCIENLYGIKLNRPIFNRNHCLQTESSLKKSPRSLLPQIRKALKMKYSDEKLRGLNKILMIDNLNVLMNSEDEHLILCPTYEFTCYYDVLRLINEDTLQANYMDITKVLNTYGLFPYVSPETPYSYEVFKAIYFDSLSKKIKGTIRGNSKQDTFWKLLSDLMVKKLESVNDKVVQYINNKIQQTPNG